MTKRRRPSGGAREFPRTARVNELLREILGDELERLDDPRLEWVSVTAVETNPELTSAVVHYSSLRGPESDPVILETLAEHRVRLQRAIGVQARLRQTPQLRFRPDIGVRAGMRVEEILRTIEFEPDETPTDGVAEATDELGSDGEIVER